ncbi:interferon-induced protein with tetratricopeptide repeats 2-like [Parambassis ranga]|uniref:Interferon-induced protein with tetratricopeptide repeats 2-like n=1 Tax=Parambassis ranga TaxID=210632 RepID=A0A6P7I4Z9_9TELE|nr:interferon-induced protein with tetratricopeptide repeats 2-like [Parambassis ranga]
MMSASQSQPTMESKLKSLQCHFTWEQGPSRSKLLFLKQELEDIGTEQGYSWLGHIYNLQGFIHYQLGSMEEARRLLSRATEAFRQMRNTVSDEGPWLVVNYGNLAWLHYHLGEQAKCQTYLLKIDALINEYPPPCEDELHAEVYAEKAWTLMKFSKDQKLLAADYFQRALRMQPDMVEWQTSRVIALVSANQQRDKLLEDDIMEKMKIAKDHDPENLYLAALYLEACAQRGEKIVDEARELATRVLRNPVSSYSGIAPLLRLYRVHISKDEAIDLAEEALERHPDVRLLKRCAAICYKWRIYSKSDSPLEHSRVARAISLYKEVISLYPHTSLKMQIVLASIYEESNRQEKADQLYKEMLMSDLDPEGKQVLYNSYGKHIFFNRKRSQQSIYYHMKAAVIPHHSPYRVDSLEKLQAISDKGRSPMSVEIKEFLANLEEPEYS